MENSDDINDIEKKLHRLEAKLKKHCIENNLEEIGSFTFMFNEEEGRNVRYIKDMEMEEMGGKLFFMINGLPIIIIGMIIFNGHTLAYARNKRDTYFRGVGQIKLAEVGQF